MPDYTVIRDRVHENEWGAFKYVEMSNHRYLTSQMIFQERNIAFSPSQYPANADVLCKVKKDMAKEAKRKGIRLTFMPYFIKASVYALQEDLRLNADVGNLEVENENHIYRINEYLNIGYAAVNEGDDLFVLNVKQSDKKSLFEIAEEISSKVHDLRVKGIFNPEDADNGTFTITNIGSFGMTYGDPILYKKESAILATGSIQTIPLAKDFKFVYDRKGKSVPTQILPLTLNIDHRVVDGLAAGNFFKNFNNFLSLEERLREL